MQFGVRLYGFGHASQQPISYVLLRMSVLQPRKNVSDGLLLLGNGARRKQKRHYFFLSKPLTLSP